MPGWSRRAGPWRFGSMELITLARKTNPTFPARHLGWFLRDAMAVNELKAAAQAQQAPQDVLAGHRGACALPGTTRARVLACCALRRAGTGTW